MFSAEKKNFDMRSLYLVKEATGWMDNSLMVIYSCKYGCL